MELRHALPTLAAAAGLGVLAAPAAAAPPWTAPQVVSDAAVRQPALAFGTGSTGVATFGFGPGSTRLLSLRAGQQPVVTASRDVQSVEDGPLPYAQTRTVVLRRRAVGQRTALGFSFGRQDTGAVGTVRGLRTVQLRPGEAELAVSPNGHAIIAFAEERGGSTRLWLSTRRAGASRFTTPRVVRGSGSVRSVAVSVNDRGRFVLAYVFGAGRTRTVEARLGTTGGSLGGVQTVGNQLGIASAAAVIAPTGRATVAWATHDGGEEQNEPTEVRTNVAPAGRATFAGQTILDRAAPGALATEPSPPSLAAAPDGTTVLGYTLSGRYVGTGTPGDANTVTAARVSVQDAAARFTAPQELASDGVVGQVAARADGTFAVPYATGVPLEGGPSPLFVALRAPGAATFGAGELVAEDADEDAAVAFEPGASGAPVVLFTRARASGAAIARRAG
ncbi:hypothetical protein [Conexibacter sp. SYSU D00693]|uniref:hypothetical protein n=1 Tax=Conexibacter sp. SYSU D00693 TaxID=2812560 RepID=UPI00196AD3C3|nr:hypothetical protein [Conexibacter sp. SYSU D00693]